jgi:L-ascorbate metabolism protein UlaG (beta-lactamase superfamily)
MKRRNFIKKTTALAAGAALLPPVFFNKFDTFGKVEMAEPASKPDISTWKDNQLNITWIGHATVLINFYGKIILTDPVMFSRVGVYFLGLTYGPSRFTAPAVNYEDLPKPDLVLLSHGHMDHTDYKTLACLTDDYPEEIDCVTSYNTADITSDLDWKSIQELDWGEETVINDIRIKALEVDHFGWRFPWEKDRRKGFLKDGRSFNAFILERNGVKILFGGDTAFHSKFLEEKGEQIDVAIMPIGAYYPWRQSHCNPEEALIMASEHLNAKYFIPIHCNTFKQGMEPIDEPLSWLHQAKKDYEIKVVISDIGETFTLT